MTTTKLKLGIGALIVAGLCNGLFASANPFESKSDQELIDMAGKVVPNQVPDYKMELHKRMQKMKPEQKEKFHEKLKASADKNTANMTMEEFEKRRQAIHEAIKARIAKMTRAQFKASGLSAKGCGCHGKCNCDVDGPCSCKEHKHHHH
ncbi:hypothetical protein NHP190012_08450 [Helicobacter sp. NHP19-012]|uniref:DUF1104 domain-containing protein n=1 Tax=Helicobacter gastrofelis TaxID=2849642 RepID=A0ABN6I6F7_9HELI|nr:DUF1104 domain-containing protein [Helicobacter sp. NHP19-012]BCZ19203.1 hypothetical protein NHP190012_08450 [Helicobacter sp. NHP19-012]